MQNYKSTTISKYLMDSHPILVIPEMAEAIGLNEAIFIQQLHFLLHVKKMNARMDDYKQGRLWVYNTLDEWVDKHFRFWSKMTLRRTINNLVSEGLVFKNEFNYSSHIHTLWYTIDYDRLDEVLLKYKDDLMEKAIKDAEKGEL